MNEGPILWEPREKTKPRGEGNKGFFPTLGNSQIRDVRANGARTGPQRTFRTV